MNEHLFPDAHTDGLVDRIEGHWDLDWPLPVPRFDPGCGYCGYAMVLKDWKFHLRSTGSKSPWRCDVRLKCLGCGCVPIYGVAVPGAYYEAAALLLGQRRMGSWINWREGKQVLSDAGFFGEE